MSVVNLDPFPIRDQLAAVAGRVVQNANMDCVWESYAACLEQQTGLKVSGDEVVDFVKGPTYQGAGNAAWIDGRVSAHFGAKVLRFDGDQQRLIYAIRDYLVQGYPSIITIPSAWNSQPSKSGYTPDSPTFSTHACAVYSIDADCAPGGAVTFMNPWHGVRQTQTVAWLKTRLCYRSIWPVEAISSFRSLAAMPGWEDDGKQLRRVGGKYVVVHGFRAFLLLHPELTSGLLGNDEPLENEQTGTAVSTQVFRYLRLIWTPANGVQLLANSLAA